MTTETALALMVGLIMTAVRAAGPMLLASLVAGLVVGVMQAATQLNEASVSFVVKVASVLAVLLLTGPAIAGLIVEYTRNCLLAIEHVVR